MGIVMKLEVCIEGVSAIVRSELSETLQCLQDDLKKRKKGNSIAIFHMEKDEDVAELQRHIEAMKLVLRYYGE
jgi:hypothetical protein